MVKKKSYGAVSLKHMNEKGVFKIIGILGRMGYNCNIDFKVNYFGGDNNAEIIIMNMRLKKDLKLMGTLVVNKGNRSA